MARGQIVRTIVLDGAKQAQDSAADRVSVGMKPVDVYILGRRPFEMTTKRRSFSAPALLWLIAGR
jgi:hypothetical protein